MNQPKEIYAKKEDLIDKDEFGIFSKKSYGNDTVKYHHNDVVEELRNLLSVSKCPNSDCDGEGNISAGEWGAQQCQFCWEKDEALK